MNIETIRAGLLQLDVENDLQWTSDGLPVIGEMKKLLGANITRAEITAAAKGFSRKNPNLDEEADPLATNEDSHQSDENELLDELEVETVPPTQPVPTKIADTKRNDKTESKVEAELDAARIALHKAQERLKEATTAMDVVIRKREQEAASYTSAHAIKAYQKSQQAQRINRFS